MSNIYGISATLAQRDEKLEKLWAEFADVPMDPETETMEGEFLDFPIGTPREDIWRWFDERHTKGVYHLLYQTGGVDRTDEIARLIYLNSLCFECSSMSCAFNHEGVCKFALVHGRSPKLTEQDGCVEGMLPF